MRPDTNPQERTARQMLTQNRPLFVGVDGDGAAHYWDSYEFAVAVVPHDGDAEKFTLAETPLETLGQWCQHVADRRGWEVGPHVGGSLLDDLHRAMA